MSIKTVTMKVPIEVRAVKGLTGRIQGYTASLGQLEEGGKTAAEAQARLLATLKRVTEENADPVIRLDPEDGHAWVLSRNAFGGWWYAHHRRDTREGAPIGATRASGWSSTGDATRQSEALAYMEKHMASLHGVCECVPPRGFSNDRCAGCGRLAPVDEDDPDPTPSLTSP